MSNNHSTPEPGDQVLVYLRQYADDTHPTEAEIHWAPVERSTKTQFTVEGIRYWADNGTPVRKEDEKVTRNGYPAYRYVSRPGHDPQWNIDQLVLEMDHPGMLARVGAVSRQASDLLGYEHSLSLDQLYTLARDEEKTRRLEQVLTGTQNAIDEALANGAELFTDTLRDRGDAAQPPALDSTDI